MFSTQILTLLQEVRLKHQRFSTSAASLGLFFQPVQCALPPKQLPHNRSPVHYEHHPRVLHETYSEATPALRTSERPEHLLP